MRVLSVTHKYSSWAQFNSIYKTRDKLSVPSTPSIQWWARYRVTVIEIPVKWEKVKGKKESLVHNSFEIKLGKCAFILIRFQDLGILCGSQLHPFIDPSFFMKGSTCLQVRTFIGLLVAAASFHFELSLALSSQLATFLLYTFLKKLVGLK